MFPKPASKPIIIILLSSILLICALFLHQCTQSEDSRFDSYTNLLFRQEVSSNAITLHYTLKDSSDYHISTNPTNLGRVTTDTDAIGASAENALASLRKFNPDKLSLENQIIYQLLENTFTLASNMAPYALYEEPLSPLTGTQAQLPVLLSEYQFYTRDDVNLYLKLLKNLPEYFQGIMEFESAKADAGLFMTEDRANAVIDECEAFVNMGNDNYLHHTFQNRLRSLNLSEKEYQYYMEENASIISTHIYPAYELLKSHLISLKNSGKNENGLCHFPEGKKYYELLVNEMTGSNRTIIELQALAHKQINDDLKNMQKVLENTEPTTDDSLAGTSNILQDSNPTSILTTLKENLSGSFPAPADVSVSIKYVDESMEDYLSPAFYLTPAIDNLKENVIYINPQHMTGDISLFTTLAHEGYPGHLYQTTYFADTAPKPIRHLLNCGGYVEGWATYCEMMSYYMIPIEKSEVTIMQKNSSIMLGLYALADMGIHYDGWTLADTADFFSDYGIHDTDAISEIYNMILGDPANYLKYYIGYVEFLELKKDAINAWGNEFTQERFHKEILEAGPMPFDILRSVLGI